MFDIGFSELVVVFVVALIILGPERLPTAAKTAGLWIRKIRRTINSVQREINAQLDQEELQKKIEQTNQRILQEGKEIQNSITPLPESELNKAQPSNVIQDIPDKQDNVVKKEALANAETASDLDKAEATETTRP